MYFFSVSGSAAQGLLVKFPKDSGVSLKADQAAKLIVCPSGVCTATGTIQTGAEAGALWYEIQGLAGAATYTVQVMFSIKNPGLAKTVSGITGH